MASTDSTYYERRAEAELELAQRANHPAAVQARYELAASYLARLCGKPATDAEHPCQIKPA